MQAAGGPCPACHGSGVAGDLDPATLARLQRWLECHPQGRALVAAALPKVRVAGPWELIDDEMDKWCRYGAGAAIEALCEARRMQLQGGSYRAVAAGADGWLDDIDSARAWCDDQLVSAGWVLVGPQPPPPTLADPCPEPGRGGRHYYVIIDGTMSCLYCSASEPQE